MPRIASPAMTLDDEPAPLPAPVASAAAIGDVARAEETPLQRSPATLRGAAAAERAGVRAAALAVAAGFAAAVERATLVEVAGATAVAGAAAGRDATAPDPRVGTLGTLRWRTAPLAVAELRAPDVALAAAVAGAGAAAVAGACVGAGAACGSAGGATTGGAAGDDTGGVAALGAVIGEAGLPNPAGVHAQARPAPATATLSSDRTNRPTMRTLVCTDPPPSTTTMCAVHLHDCGALRNETVVACRPC